MSAEQIPMTDGMKPPVPPAPAELLEVVNTSGLELETANGLLTTFAAFFAQAKKWRDQVAGIIVTDVSQVREMKLARESRLALREIRINVEHARKRLKEDSLRYGRTVDAIATILKNEIEPLEGRLQEQETFAVRKEAARKAALSSERAAALQAVNVDPTFFALAEMPVEQFDQLLATSRTAYEAKLAREAKEAEDARLAAEKAEADRIAREQAEAAERERIRQENERLKREAVEREEAARVERERVAKEREVLEAAAAEERRKAAEALRVAEEKAKQEREAAAAKAAQEALLAAEQARREREAIEAKAKAEREAAEEAQRIERERLQAIAERERQKTEAARAKAESEAHTQRVAREQAEAQLRAAEEARVAKEQTEREAAERAAAAPDREKLIAFATVVRGLSIPAMATERGQTAVQEINLMLNEVARTVERKGREL